MVKNLPAMQETQVRSLGWEDLLETGMVTHYSILDWRISWTEEPGGLQSIALQRVGHDLVTKEQQQMVMEVDLPASFLPQMIRLGLAMLERE